MLVQCFTQIVKLIVALAGWDGYDAHCQQQQWEITVDAIQEALLVCYSVSLGNLLVEGLFDVVVARHKYIYVGNTVAK